MWRPLVTWRHSVMEHFYDVAANRDMAAISYMVAGGGVVPFSDGALP